MLNKNKIIVTGGSGRFGSVLRKNVKNNYLFPKKNELNFINVGTGIDITIKELSEKIAKILQYEGKIIWDQSKPDGTFKKQLDVSRINKLGWHSKINLDEGIRKTIKEFTLY